jgi:hypothetical protein
MIIAATSAHLASPGACLDDLLASRFLPKKWMRRIWSARELPPRLQHCVHALRSGSEWRAYGDEDQIFFAIARMHAADASGASATAIDAYFLDESAVVYAAGVWNFDRQAGWWLDAVMESSYDCEHGWWLGAVLGPRAPTGRRCATEPSGAAEFRLMISPPATPEASDAQGAQRRKPR